MIEKIKRKLKILRMREQQAIKDMNFAECLRLDGAISHIEDLYQYAMSASQPINAAAGKSCPLYTDYRKSCKALMERDFFPDRR